MRPFLTSKEKNEWKDGRNERTSLKGANVDMANVVSRNSDLVRIEQVPMLSPKEAKKTTPKHPETVRELSTNLV